MPSDRASVRYREKPGRGNKMFWPRFVSTEIARSMAPEHPLANIMSFTQHSLPNILLLRYSSLYIILHYFGVSFSRSNESCIHGRNHSARRPREASGQSPRREVWGGVLPPNRGERSEEARAPPEKFSF